MAPQADYVVSNGTGAAVRSDINGQLAAIVSNNSGATAPATTYAYQWWADTTTGLLKIRNSANSAWVTLFELDGTLIASDISLGAGTVGAPSLFFTGDVNTGLFSPGADTLALVTAGTNRVHVTSGGLVGLGTSSPSNTAGFSQQLQLTGNIPCISIDNTGTGANKYSLGVNSTGALGFWDNTASAFRMYINSSGNVGIATTAPNRKLEVSDASADNFIRVNTTGVTKSGIEFASGGTVYGQLYFNNVSPYDLSLLQQYTTGSLILGTNNTERARIDSSGRLIVGIIASPANQLQVSTDSAGKPSTNTWTIVSDQRIKEDIELANLDLCYEAIKNIPLKRFKWRDEVYTDEQVRDRRKLGWIAQDVEAVFPKAVGTYEFKYNQVFEETIIPAVEEELDADGNVITPAQPERTEQGDLISEDVIEDCRDLNADQLYAAMYGAVQKLMAKVETLEASNADLLARVTALEAA
jgi:hypothetical protein